MPDYSISFARKMSDISVSIASEGSTSEDDQRVITYIALIACEVALKAALEKAGVSAKALRKCSHDLCRLLSLMSKCRILTEQGLWINASIIRSLIVDDNYGDATVGKLLEAERQGASKFPIHIRYGATLNHYPASVLACLSKIVVNWVNIHYEQITLPK